jgi:mannose-6-phosphate isomerase-like protein (cupin superfamily)
MTYQAINFGKKFALFDEQWEPRVVAEMNDYQFKIVKLQGDFIWHDHKDTDETFLVMEGELRIDFRDGAVRVAAGEMFVVPKGVEHKPYAEQEVKLLLIEPRRTTYGFDCYVRLSTIAAATSISAMPTTSAGSSRSPNSVVPRATAITGETKA